LKEKLKETVR